MKITLIYPSIGEKIKSLQLEPLTMAALAGLTPGEIRVAFYDDRLEEIPYDEPTDLACISVQTFTARRAYQISSEFRKRNVRVILGGFHPAFMPDEAAENADSVALGEAEDLWKNILKDAGNGKLRKFYKAGTRSLLAGLKPDRRIFEGKKYAPVSLVEFGRGCRFACSFCSVCAFFEHRKICRPVPEVVGEIKLLGKRKILFIDDDLVNDMGKAAELFMALAPLKIKWIAQAGVEIANNEGLLRLAAESGCFGLLIGFESLNEKNLRQMHKGPSNNPEFYQEAIRRIHSHGIKICASYIFGYDCDTLESFGRTLDFSLKQKFILANFNHLTPYPGTPLYWELKRQGRLLYDKWWLEPKINWGDVVFEPSGMSTRGLYESCKTARFKFYSLLNILKRGFLKVNFISPLFYFALNYLVRKEIREKQGFPFGRNP